MTPEEAIAEVRLAAHLCRVLWARSAKHRAWLIRERLAPKLDDLARRAEAGIISAAEAYGDARLLLELTITRT